MEPYLESISSVIPDQKINHEIRQRFYSSRGPRSKINLSQFYRVHLLLCLKQIPSWNYLIHELKHNRNWRKFARIKNIRSVPSIKLISQFRTLNGTFVLRQINEILVQIILSLIDIPLMPVLVPDSTDIEAACNGYAKKTAPVENLVTILKYILQKGLPKVIGQRNQANRNSL